MWPLQAFQFRSTTLSVPDLNASPMWAVPLAAAAAFVSAGPQIGPPVLDLTLRATSMTFSASSSSPKNGSPASLMALANALSQSSPRRKALNGLRNQALGEL